MPASDRDEALKDLGRLARERREDIQLTLDEIYERTRVRLEYLRGIEQGNYQGVPDLVYVKGFVRTYLSVISAEDLRDEFMTWLNRENTPKARTLPPTNVLGNGTSPTKGFKPASHFWLFTVLILVLLGSGGYVWYSWANSPIVVRLRPEDRSPSHFPMRGVVSEEVSSHDTPAAISDDAALQAFSVSRDIVPPPESKPAQPKLHVKAKTDVWMKVTIADRVIYSNTLKSGSETSWDLPSRAKVTYGRAAAADIFLNGNKLTEPHAKGTYHYEPDGTYRRLQ
jgi:cytoskeletal protein RodZ